MFFKINIQLSEKFRYPALPRCRSCRIRELLPYMEYLGMLRKRFASPSTEDSSIPLMVLHLHTWMLGPFRAKNLSTAFKCDRRAGSLFQSQEGNKKKKPSVYLPQDERGIDFYRTALISYQHNEVSNRNKSKEQWFRRYRPLKWTMSAKRGKLFLEHSDWFKCFNLSWVLHGWARECQSTSGAMSAIKAAIF